MASNPENSASPGGSAGRLAAVHPAILLFSGFLLACAALVLVGLLNDLGMAQGTRVATAIILVLLAFVFLGWSRLNGQGRLVLRLASAAGGTSGDPSSTFGAISAPLLVCFVLIGLATLGCIVLLSTEYIYKTTALLCALASLAGGGVLGFLFAIPKVLQDGQPTPVIPNPTNPQPASPQPALNNLNLPAGASATVAAPSRPALRVGINTSLEQISDWLTKIIVGLGLVELRNFPYYLRHATDFVARGLSAPTGKASLVYEARTLSAAVLVFFTLLGFLGIYMITRLYLAREFVLADEGTVRVGGTVLTPAEAAAQLVAQVTDLQGQVLDMRHQSGPDAGRAAGVGAAQAATPKRILWVHEDPRGEAILRDQLTARLGAEIQDVTTTSQALSRLQTGGYGLVITDMARREGMGIVNSAGRDLALQVRSAEPNLPVAIFTNPARVERYRSDISALNNVLLTASPTDVVAFAEKALA